MLMTNMEFVLSDMLSGDFNEHEKRQMLRWLQINDEEWLHEQYTGYDKIDEFYQKVLY